MKMGFLQTMELAWPAEELKNYFIKNFKRFAEQYAGVNSSI